jgi:hypothetical protein
LFGVFGFLKDCLKDNVRIAIQRRGGFKEVVSRGHEGKTIEIELQVRMQMASKEMLESDLKASIPRVIQSWRHPNDVPFVILHDQDSADCVRLKSGLVGLVPEGRRGRTTVRIVVRELEAWYLGDLQAVEAAGGLKSGAAQRLSKKVKFRDPEALTNAKEVFFRLTTLRGQLATARAMSNHLLMEGNRCASFNLFIATLRQHLAAWPP